MVHKWLYLPAAPSYVKSILFIFLSLRLKHGLEHKAESVVMTAFWCHRELPFGDQSRLTDWVDFSPIHFCPLAPWKLTWNPSINSMLMSGITGLLSGYNWEDSKREKGFPLFTVSKVRSKRYEKWQLTVRISPSGVQGNTRTSTSA